MVQVNRENIKKKMKIFIITLLNMMFVAGGFICAKNTDKPDNSLLPDSRPADIIFTYNVSGGMMYYSENLFISADSCYYSINDGGSVSRTNFTLSSKELDRLYEKFIDNDFDRIGTYEEKVYDRGGKTISLSWGNGKHCSQSSSGMTFIDKAWLREWTASVSSIENIIAEEIPKHKKDYEIRLDKSLFDNEVYMQVNRDVVIPKSMLMSENGMDKFIARKVSLSPGKHRLSLSYGKKYDQVDINIDSSKAVLLYLENDTLRHKYIN